MSRLQPSTARLVTVLQEASDLAKTVELPDGNWVRPILAAIVQDLQDPVVPPPQASNGKPLEWRAPAGR